MDTLTEHEKRAKEGFERTLPQEAAQRIWNLYLKIRRRERKFYADLKTYEEKDDVIALKKAGLIRFEPNDPTGREQSTYILPLRI